MSHAIAAWMSGAKVLGFRIGKNSGHVDVSHSNAWIALAPYVVPIYALGLVGAYRLALWAPPYHFFVTRLAYQLFLFGMGLAVSFHVTQTFDALWGQHQPDLDHAGGVVFSLAVIAFANGLFFIVALKFLFPGAVSVERSLSMVWSFTATCWSYAYTPLGALVPWIRETWRA